MKTKSIIVLAISLLLVISIFPHNFVNAQTVSSTTSSTYVRTQPPSFNTYYGSNVQTYWPILGDRETCEARQDLLLTIPPAGCQPAVVRSDLLAEQNVPVFCQIDAIKINPLIDISQIRNIRFRGQYPPEVAGSGFHPARAALRTHDRLLGSPLINNIGYAVVILKRQPDESKLPDFVNVTLQADIEYISGNAYGIGRSEFLLEKTDESDWQREKLKQSFWNGRYFIRLEDADSNFASVSIYEGDRKFTTLRVEKGKTSREIFVPGMFCRAGLEVSYDGFVNSGTKARIEVSSGNDVDVFDVHQGSKFLDNRCSITRIDTNKTGIGRVTGQCKGQQFVLELKSKAGQQNGTVNIKGANYEIEETGEEYEVTFNKERYKLDKDNQLLKFPAGGGQSITLINSTGHYNQTLSGEERAWLRQLQQDLTNFKSSRQESVGRTLEERQLSEETKIYFQDAISSYEEVADSYPDEADGEYGKEALTRAIKLAGDFGKDQTKIRLINKFIETYPNTANSTYLVDELNKMHKIDSTLAGEVVEFDDKARTIKLLDISEPTAKPTAYFIVENDRLNVELRERKPIKLGSTTHGEIIVENINPDEVELSAYCMEKDSSNRTRLSSTRQRFKLIAGGSAIPICELDIRLDRTNAQKVAKIRILPKAEGTRTQTNVTINIGIEKRAIKLTPDKTLERIERINKSIEKWQKISDKLGKVVTGLKGACFATSALLTFKNFMSGLSGEALARQEVMGGDNGWRNWCKEHSGPNREYPSLDACYLDKASDIDRDVSTTTSAISRINQKISSIQNQHKNPSHSIFGQSINTEEMRKALAAEIKSQYPGMKINMGDKVWIDNGQELKDVPIEKVLTDENVKNGLVTTDGLRSMWLNLELQKTGSLSEGIKTNSNSKLTNIAQQTYQNVVIDAEFKRDQARRAKGLPGAFFATPENQQLRVAEVGRANTAVKTAYTGFDDLTHVATVIVPARKEGESGTGAKFEAGTYILGLTEADARKGIYTVSKIWKESNNAPIENTAEFVSTYGIGNLKSTKTVSYHNEINPAYRKCSYYETEPYRGMPAVIPFDYRNGWYAATKQTLPAFGGIGAFDASGRVTSFWLCNVGDNGKVEFETGLGDDLCQQINLNTGQPLGVFPGLSEQEAKSKITQAITAIQEAARQHGNKFINVGGERCEVGPPSTGQPGTQCQDFMSPKDCHLLFNVCDPVICPPSRCNFGGQYPVANVVQTGIIGSIFLCLPNIREKIFIPVCLTGIQAGIDAFISIMRAHRDCLQESLETGQMVGICDQVYSIYLCEFFWNQIAPVVNILIPKLIEIAYGQGVRGGGEYLTVMGAWQNMENSINYFTNTYAVNSIKAFQVKSVEEVGTQFCKAFISAKAPTAFKTLIEPDSPPQFHAWFDAKTYTTATVPATSQYKVFYHIFAGKDQGVHFNVYLKNPPESSYYATTPYVQVASGFIPRGEYASETRDFTAPEGYKELCVRINEQEECGFGQVSTSFAIDYLRDSYVSDQAKNARITSEKECVGGTQLNPAALLTPNIQQGVEEAINPEIYNRGIIRICSTQNPGISTDPLRFQDVGYCDDQKIRCWIDKTSIDNAITDSNLLLKNQTLQELEQQTKQYIEGIGEFFTPEEGIAEIRSLNDALASLEAKRGDKKSDAVKILNRIDTIFPMFFFSHHKAHALLIKGKVNEIVARQLIKADDEKVRKSRKVETPEEVPKPTEPPAEKPPKELPEILMNKTPYYEDDSRLRIDFGIIDNKNIGSYSLNPWNDQLEWLNMSGWIIPLEWGKNTTGGNWLTQLRDELVTYKQQHPWQKDKTEESFDLKSYTAMSGKKAFHEVDILYNSRYIGIYFSKLKEGRDIKVEKNNAVDVPVGSIQEDDKKISMNKLVENKDKIEPETYKHLEFLNGKYYLNGEFHDSLQEREKWTLESAIEEAKKRTGKYSDNKIFIDLLYNDALLDKDEYEDIKGEGWWLSEDMDFVLKVLEGELERKQTMFSLTSKKEQFRNTGKYVEFIYNNNKKTNSLYLDDGDVQVLTKGTVFFNVVGEYDSTNPNPLININNLRKVHYLEESSRGKTILKEDYDVLKELRDREYTYNELKQGSAGNGTNNPEIVYYNVSHEGGDIYHLFIGSNPLDAYIEEITAYPGGSRKIERRIYLKVISQSGQKLLVGRTNDLGNIDIIKNETTLPQEITNNELENFRAIEKLHDKSFEDLINERIIFSE